LTAPTAPPQATPRHDDPPGRGRLSALARHPAFASRRDAMAAVLWMVAIVPAAMGFWLVAGSLAGVAPAQVPTLVAASLLGLAIGTLLQVAFGFRLPMYEGPAAAYLAAITVVAAEGRHDLAAITGGLMAAGAFVALLGVLGADRVIAKAFTPLVANVFVLTVTLAVLPATVQRALGATRGLPGKGAAWAATVVVVVVTLALRRSPRLIPYSLLAALIAGTATYVGLAGAPRLSLGRVLVAPPLLPWGAPSASAGVVAPFLLAGALAAFNTVASGKVVSIAHDLPIGHGAQRRSFVMHGAAQASSAVVGNLVGTVSRVDSIGIAHLLDHRGRAPLLVCGVLVGALGFVRPFVRLAAALPLSVSAALLAMLLLLILAHAARGIARERRALVALVVGPAMIPTAVWIAVGSSLAPTLQLVANPMLWGVLLAVALERIVAPRAAAAQSRRPGTE
jgi:xanthine/uracil permease